MKFMRELLRDRIYAAGGSCWSGWAAARPLFCPHGPSLHLTRPLLSTFDPAKTLRFVVLWKYFLWFITPLHQIAPPFAKIQYKT